MYDVFGNIAPVSWGDDTVGTLFSKIQFSEPLTKNFIGTQSALSLVQLMLSKDPLHRIGLDSALSHPFFLREGKPAPLAVTEAELLRIVRSYVSYISYINEYRYDHWIHISC